MSRAEREPVSAMRADIEKAFSPPETVAPVEIDTGRRAAPAVAAAAATAKPEGGFVRKEERRKSDRRGMDALRDEALRNIISQVEDRNFGGLRNRVPRRRNFNPTRIVLLAVAVIAGGLAAYLSLQGAQPAPQPTPEAAVEAAPQVVQEPRAKILVAKQAIGVGERLSPLLVEWADWPEGALRPDYITVAATPTALEDMTGAVARLEIFPGEPIREEKLARAEDGYLSAVLDPGMRGVSVSVSPEAGSGGFIVPNDHVDVLWTRTSSSGAQISDTILTNVRVLAIDTRLGETGATGAAAAPDDPRAEVFQKQVLATLALDPAQVEVVTNSSTIGRLTLVVRSTVDFAATDTPDDATLNRSIRLTSPFWAK